MNRAGIDDLARIVQVSRETVDDARSVARKLKPKWGNDKATRRLNFIAKVLDLAAVSLETIAKNVVQLQEIAEEKS